MERTYIELRDQAVRKVLSIIIPSYNTSCHIDRCVPYFLKCKNLPSMELLFINDGSIDDTAEKLAQYEKIFPDTIHVINKENGGHGSVINRGIKEATGKYFKVVDGDDWVEPEGLDHLIEDLKTTNADLVINPYFKQSQVTGKKTLNGIWKIVKEQEISISDLPAHILGLQLHEWTIKTSILKENDISFTEHCFYEDFEYITYPMPYITTLLFLDYPVYDYLVDQATQSVSDKNVYKNAWMSKKVIFDTIQFYKENRPKERRADMYMSATILNGCKQHYNIYLRNGREYDSYKKWCEFDNDLYKYPEIYDAIGKNYKYILFVRKTGKFGFAIDAGLIHIYKRILKK